MPTYRYKENSKGRAPTETTHVRSDPNVKVISAEAFRRCVCLEEIKIPSTVHTIGCRAFSGCKGLTNIILPT